MSDKKKIAIATGDPAGIGPEIGLKTALDPAVRSACNPIVFSAPDVIERHARACGINLDMHVIERITNADWSGSRVNVLACKQSESAKPLLFGTNSAAYGRDALIFAATAIKAALAGEVDAVVAGPHNQKSISLAGIKFDGYPKPSILDVCFTPKADTDCTSSFSAPC